MACAGARGVTDKDFGHKNGQVFDPFQFSQLVAERNTVTF